MHELLPIGQYGVWRSTQAVTPALAARIEGLGYGALWIGGSPGSELRDVEDLLDATQSLVVVTGIVNIWHADAAETAASFHRIEARHPGRFLLGIGTGHREKDAARTRPYETIVAYLDVLDAEGVPKDRRLLAALGPRVMRLAGERTRGAHPYLTTPEHTRWAREILGPDALLAPEQKVVGRTDAAEARAEARARLDIYLHMENYLTTMRRWGFTEADVAEPGSDALVDRLAPWGDTAALAAALRAHLDAGADHVSAQVLPLDDPIAVLEPLAEELGLSR